VTFGAGKASQVIERVPLCPSNTFISVNDCVILSGAKEGNVSFFILVLFILTHVHKHGLSADIVLSIILKGAEHVARCS
jgi:hypothetical protein